MAGQGEEDDLAELDKFLHETQTLVEPVALPSTETTNRVAAAPHQDSPSSVASRSVVPSLPKEEEYRYTVLANQLLGAWHRAPALPLDPEAQSLVEPALAAIQSRSQLAPSRYRNVLLWNRQYQVDLVRTLSELRFQMHTVQAELRAINEYGLDALDATTTTARSRGNKGPRRARDAGALAKQEIHLTAQLRAPRPELELFVGQTATHPAETAADTYLESTVLPGQLPLSTLDTVHARYTPKTAARWTVEESRKLHTAVLQQLRQRLCAQVQHEATFTSLESTPVAKLSASQLKLKVELDRRLHEVATAVPSRSALACALQWNVINPVRHRSWSKEDDKRLRELVLSRPHQTWAWYTEQLQQDRHPVDVFMHWQQAINPSLVKRNWSSADDDRLRTVMRRIGNSDWTAVAQAMGDRTPQQCNLRWTKVLDPRLASGPWSDQELTQLRTGVQMFSGSCRPVQTNNAVSATKTLNAPISAEVLGHRKKMHVCEKAWHVSPTAGRRSWSICRSMASPEQTTNARDVILPVLFLTKPRTIHRFEKLDPQAALDHLQATHGKEQVQVSRGGVKRRYLTHASALDETAVSPEAQASKKMHRLQRVVEGPRRPRGRPHSGCNQIMVSFRCEGTTNIPSIHMKTQKLILILQEYNEPMNLIWHAHNNEPTQSDICASNHAS
ncbi:uncharacterized protein MONBRDRAFT_22022 [Monosiga brevicollis MX1]|uniref:Uncharacterized protein n=1 Tax=Monosiga brevicollis TaxID=81824 RepID=A9UPB3_MONBE|nr:uncharacterized protein MONBRDRAFT_22022 [Monosiga brevicollis MX1]EDQ92846.1 predicted protein [Monosiga brevicollis MX1]|eukprot:XP_001742608.1 hypothetical protein [Monosiga brevicollis MX1]